MSIIMFSWSHNFCLYRFIKDPLAGISPSLDRKCCPEGCWYCSDLCHHCMQPSNTLFSGVIDDTLLKFCSEKCKGLWFPSPDQMPLHAASYLGETCQSDDTVAPLMTLISQKEGGVEQFYLYVSGVSTGSEKMERPYILWHVRELKHQHFAHFYISKDCLPLDLVWAKQICNSEDEAFFNHITTKQTELQAHLQKQLNEAVKVCGFENYEAFLGSIDGASLQNGKFHCQTCSFPLLVCCVELPALEIQKPAIRSNLPPGFTFCDPGLGLAHGSLKSPMGVSDLLHCVNVDGCFRTVYLLSVANLFDLSSAVELYLISMKHHVEEGWYFVDGVVLSTDGTRAMRFLTDEPVYERDPESLEEMNAVAGNVVPEMLRKSGISSIEPLLCLTKYTWLVP